MRMVQDTIVFDMTYSDSDEDWCPCGSGHDEDGNTAYFESYLDLTDGINGKKVGKGPESMGAFIRAVRAKGVHGGEVNVIVDS